MGDVNPYACKCRKCGKYFGNRRDLYNHRLSHHIQTGTGSLQPSPYAPEQEPWQSNDALKEIYQINSPLILHRHQDGPVRSIYNMPLTNDFSTHELMEAMEEIYDR